MPCLRALLAAALVASPFALAGASRRAVAQSEAQAIVANYARIVEASYRDSVEAARRLESAIAAFTKKPTASGLEKAKQAWIEARKIYGQTEVYRFSDGPIDDEDGPEGLINAWPLDEAYIDAVQGDAKTGIINRSDLFPRITKELLVSLNEKDGETNVATGFHAIEFLLWGQDLSAEGPGRRPYTDYVPGKGKNAVRRSTYLKLTASLLTENLASVHAEWENPTRAYSREFLTADPNVSLAKIIQGLTTLAGFELSGERMLAAVASQSQEDEHSCFSDTTHLDLRANAQGLVNVFEGQYGSIQGPGLRSLLASIDAPNADRLARELAEAVAAIEAIPVPFDRALGTEEGRAAIEAAAAKLEIFAKGMVTAAKKLGLEVTIGG